VPGDVGDRLGMALLVAARNAIAQHFGLPTRPLGVLPELGEPGATFVTLTRSGQLRGLHRQP
jgi:hypothetical protein